ncbi:TPA: M56 family metallopeptidase [Clostridioides difficile]|nr:M56 family metallopeptidase [Clostridioides difficile]HBF4061942.1 M56 family metallopeptidase [Clostridioides difficile]HBF6021743.1 M56 family metallopeptidase [Clostridioides difficile]HEK8843444.1 M56 family metallopeptidase [Clostridioides difficile]HEK8922269.1 M56 family metallopeptidase [Clostridioides difficile]
MLISGVSIYSFMSALVFSSIGLLLIAILRNHNVFFIKERTSLLLLLLVLSILRLLIPLDLHNTLLIESDVFIPWIQQLLEKNIFYNVNLGELLVIIWIVVAILFFVTSILAYIVEYRKINIDFSIKDKQVEKISKEEFAKNSVIRVSYNVDIPRVTGILKAYVYLPPLKLSDNELRYIIQHEIQHIKGKDILIKFFYTLLRSVFWWNPVIHILNNEVDDLLELRCDLAVAKNMDYDTRVKYLQTILNVLKQKKNKNKVFLLPSFIGNKNNQLIKQRFEVVLSDEYPKNIREKIITICLFLFLFIFSYFIILQPVIYPPQEDVVSQVVITNENAYLLIRKDGSIDLYINGVFYEKVSNDELETYPISELKDIRKEK